MELPQFLRSAFFSCILIIIIDVIPVFGMLSEQQLPDLLLEESIFDGDLFSNEKLEEILQALDGQGNAPVQTCIQQENVTPDSDKSESHEELSGESDKAASDCSSSDLSEHKCLYNNCGKNFGVEHKDEFYDHVIQHLSCIPGRCAKKHIDCPWDDCKVTVKNGNYLQAHIFWHIDKRSFQCPYQKCTFKGAIQRGNFNKHLKEKHRNTKHTCRVCMESFKTQKNLLEHFWQHPGYAPFTCPVCKTGFDGYDAYKKHKQEMLCAKPINE